ncbi:hypothetical protein MNBD_GAMMA11-1123 [hydrothermal vent metagenome]|uniref:N-acetyltransferase domain-containing protein n=1 Tax=hydrothermal vent metagenome TaxID=652676 RepID=A0A3B0X4L8_9ZZZZ
MSRNYRLDRLKPDDYRHAFDCGDFDLNEYYLKDSKAACIEYMAVSYALYLGDEVIAFYCVSNEGLRRDITTGRRFKRIQKKVKTAEKRYRSMPAVKIGRFAVSKGQQGDNIGSMLMDAIKRSFVTDNKTGCRFIVVDAYNKSEVIRFYKQNGFDFLHDGDKKEDTRIMVFDLVFFADARNA